MSKRNGYLPEGMDEEGGSACCIGTLSFSTLQERLERCSFLRCSLLPRTMLPCSVECQVCVCACVWMPGPCRKAIQLGWRDRSMSIFCNVHF